MSKLTFSVVLCGVTLALGSARADEYIVLEDRAGAFDTWSSTVDPVDEMVTVVSRDMGVDRLVLEEQRRRTGLGWGGLSIANALAAETGKSFDEIVALKQAGHGWGWIAKQNNLKVGPIVSRLNRVDDGVKHLKVKTNNGNVIKVKGGKGKVKVKGAKGNGNGNGKGKAKGKGKGSKK